MHTKLVFIVTKLWMQIKLKSANRICANADAMHFVMAKFALHLTVQRAPIRLPVASEFNHCPQ